MSAPAPLPLTVDPLAALADRCVQCGLCLPACPTYAVDRIEAESPRGRIALARAIALSTIEPTPAGENHLDQCLACRSCEAVCPAHVEFGELLVQARAAQRVRRPAGWRQRAAEALVTRRRLLNAVFGTYRTIAPLLPRVLRPLPLPPPRTRPPPGACAPTRVALFTGCVADAYETRVRTALRTLCAALGVEVIEPVAQACCGALHAHAGADVGATALAVRNQAAFAHADVVLTLASGCHGAVAAALGSTRTHDALAWLALHVDRLAFVSSPRRIGLHVPCTQRNVARSSGAMRALLARVDALELVELDAGPGCCGASGMQMLTDRDRADLFRAPLLEQARAARVDAIASANIGCRLHLGNGTSIPVLHPIELLADALRAAV